ncbi:hypothetical protein GCM10012319_63450 [Comamonas sp. KCTC 72670]|nr:hypothetical protein GCM10012319_63450 [Comamonas sp. KCTC 72670]
MPLGHSRGLPGPGGVASFTSHLPRREDTWADRNESTSRERAEPGPLVLAGSRPGADPSTVSCEDTTLPGRSWHLRCGPQASLS